MDYAKKQQNIIIKTLAERGEFAISDVEKGSDISRSSIGNILRKLIDDGILVMSPQTGTGARYKMAVNERAMIFLFGGIEQATIELFANAWGVGVSSAKKYIKSFVDSGLLVKQGLPPQKIIYSLVLVNKEHGLSNEQKNILEKFYAYVTPDGQFLKGVRGFVYWAENKSGRKDIKALVQEYIDTRRKYYNDKSRVFLIDATDKLQQVFRDKTCIKKLFHRDFDALPVFGKTYLSLMVRIAKSGRANAPVMTSIVERIQDSIKHIIAEYDIDAVGFIPPTVMRKTQLMTFLARRLDISLPVVSITKSKSFAPVQQKSLRKLEDRVLNASKTIIVDSKERYSRVLLIDDVTGSGATLNETARNIIESGIAREVYGFTITGSAKAGVFDVISEA